MRMGKRVFIGQNVLVDAIHPELLVIGDDCIVTDGVKLLTHFLDTSHMDNDHQYLGNLEIKSGAFIGLNALFVQPVVVGNRAVVAAGSVVVCNIPADEIWGGVPAKFIAKRGTKSGS